MVGFVGQTMAGSTQFDGGWVMVSSSMHGLVAAVAIGLAFIPPGAYVRFIRSRV
jgi:hypothetical protein